MGFERHVEGLIGEVRALEKEWEGIVGEMCELGMEMLGERDMRRLFFGGDSGEVSNIIDLTNDDDDDDDAGNNVDVGASSASYTDLGIASALFTPNLTPIRAPGPVFSEDQKREVEDRLRQLGDKDLEEMENLAQQELVWIKNKCQTIADVLKE